MNRQRPASVPSDHPLYFKRGRDRELREEWARRKRALLLFFLPGLLASLYLVYWFATAVSGDIAEAGPLPREVRAALATLTGSLVGGALYWIFLAHCPRCDFPVGFDWTLAGVFGRRPDDPVFHCRNCKARLT